MDKLHGPEPGDVLELTVTEAAHGGWCVARAVGSAGQDSASQDTAGQDTASQDSASQDNAGQDTAGQDETAGKVVFVRHALPGERVKARVTSSTARFARAEAVEVLSASPDRVEPPCRYAHPG